MIDKIQTFFPKRNWSRPKDNDNSTIFHTHITIYHVPTYLDHLHIPVSMLDTVLSQPWEQSYRWPPSPSLLCWPDPQISLPIHECYWLSLTKEQTHNCKFKILPAFQFSSHIWLVCNNQNKIKHRSFSKVNSCFKQIKIRLFDLL